MNVSSHLQELQRRHETLGRKIEVAEKRPGSDSIELTSLKKQKLRLKDEIERLRGHLH